MTDKVITTSKFTTETDKFVKIYGTNAASHSNGGVGFAKAIFSVKDSDDAKTILVSELADKFAASGSTSGGKITLETDSANALPDAWENLI